MKTIIEKIQCNKIRCKKCGDIIESKTCHDFNWCSCKSVAVDGGHGYLRRCGEPKNIEDLSFVRKLVKIDTTGFEEIKNILFKKSFDFENIQCPFCNSKNISIQKGRRELIIGDCITALVCHDCKKIYCFGDVKYKNDKDIKI